MKVELYLRISFRDYCRYSFRVSLFGKFGPAGNIMSLCVDTQQFDPIFIIPNLSF